MLSTPADFPFFNDCTAASTSLRRMGWSSSVPIWGQSSIDGSPLYSSVQYSVHRFSISHLSVRHFPEWSWTVVAFPCFRVIKSFMSWYALLLLFFLRFYSVSLQCSPIQFSFSFFMHLLMLLFTSLYFSDPSGSSHYFLSSLILSHKSRISAVIQGFFFWRCLPRISLAVSVTAVLKVVIIESMSVSSLPMMVRGANLPPIVARKVSNSKLRWSTMGLCRATSPSPTASSRDAFWPPHFSPCSSASYSVRQKTTCQTASTSVSGLTAVSSTFCVSSHARKPSRNSSLSCCLLTIDHFSTARRKPYSTSSTASLMQPRTLASPSAWRRLRCCTNSERERHTVLKKASMAPTKRSGALHLPVWCHLQWCHSQQGSWQLHVQSKQFLWKTVKESIAESLAPPFRKDPGILGPCRSHFPVRCRDLGSLSEADRATEAVSPTLLALHLWHHMVI